MAKVYVFLANGFEDVEALIPVDVLRRGGVEVVTVSVVNGSQVVETAHRVRVEADTMFADCDFPMPTFFCSLAVCLALRT